MMKTFWFSSKEKGLFSKEFELWDDAECFAEDNGYHFYGPVTEEAARQRMEEYGDTKYTRYTCPHLYCGDCKYFGRNCKRVDHKTVKFYKPCFSSYHNGEHHIPCKEFEPAHPEYAAYRDQWNGIEDIWPVYRDTWLKGQNMDHIAFHINDDFNTDYYVPFDLFYNGGMIEDGVLKATVKQTTVRDKVDLGVQLYKLKKEKIAGVDLSTGTVITEAAK